MSSDPPVVKPKTVTRRPAANKSRDSSSDRNTQGSPGTDTSNDEEFARQLQDQLLREQQEMDEQLARQLHDEERSKQPVASSLPPSGPGGRPMSATPLQSLFHTLFGMTARTMELDEEDEEEGTPAMDPETDPTPVPSRPGRGPVGVSRPLGARNVSPRRPLAGRSPERQRRGVNRSPERGAAGAGRGTVPGSGPLPGSQGYGVADRGERGGGNNSSSEPVDLLPGVRPNPARVGFRPRRMRRVIVGANPSNALQQETGSEELEGAGNVRPISAMRRPGLGPREDTMPLPDGELDPDFMVLDLSPAENAREDNFVNIMRDPFFLMLLLMGRHPDFLVPDDVDIGDYEALWEMAERLGEVKNRGMKEDEINRLPTRTYRRRATGKPEMCSICLSEFKSGERVQLLPCKHEFHALCLPEWLKRNASCPVCRQEVKKSPVHED